MEWNGMEWKTMEWNGMEWNGMEWNGMEWNGMEWNGMEWNGTPGTHTALRCSGFLRVSQTCPKLNVTQLLLLEADITSASRPVSRESTPTLVASVINPALRFFFRTTFKIPAPPPPVSSNRTWQKGWSWSLHSAIWSAGGIWSSVNRRGLLRINKYLRWSIGIVTLPSISVIYRRDILHHIKCCLLWLISFSTL